MPGPGPLGLATPVPYEVTASPVTTLTVTGSDGQEYVVKIAGVISGVFDTGMRNPIDQMPLFNIAMNTVVEVKRKTNA